MSHVAPVSLGGDGFTFSKPSFVQHQPSDSHVVIPDAHLLFSGDYTRIGNDLIISGAGQKLVVGNYFKGETRPALTSKDGATLAGHIVDALTGHVHYAQATAAAPAAGQVIGNVLKLSGSASCIRNGVSIELHIGDAIQKGDVIQTGSDSSIGMTFVDGSAFGMNSNARMVLNEMIYDPNGSSNSSLMSLVQGTITFVAGQTAKNGNMRVETPVATMGIRGTAVLVEIGANDGPTKFSVLVEPDGHTGSYNLYDKATGQLIGTVSQAGQVTYVSSLGIGQPPTAIEQLKTLQDQQNEKAIIQQVFQLYFPNYNPDNSNPKSPKFGSNTSGNNLAEIIFTTNSDQQKVFLTQIELRFAVTDPVTGITTYQNRIFYNTKAQFSASSILSEQTLVSTVESFKISDLVHIDDPDIGNAPFYDVATPFVAGSAIIKSAVSTNPHLDANFLTQFLHINQTTGVITFDRLGFNFLGDGESVTFMVQVTSRSGPDVANVIIPIKITGDNDVPNDNGAPTIVLSLSDIIGAVKEDTLFTPDHTIVKNGTITFRDVDLSDGHQAGVVFTSSTSGSTLNPTSNPSLPGFGPNAQIGTFTIGPVVESETDTINTGTVGWHFTLNENDPTLQSLAEGQTITQVYTITITDEHGAFVTQAVTITITGTNDAPVIDAIAATSLNEQTDTSTLTLALPIHVTFGDVDLSDVGHTALITAVTTIGVTTGLSLTPAQLIALVTPITSAKAAGSSAGSVDLGFSAPSTAFDYLASGETIKLTYTVTVSDGDGGTTPATFDVTITGTNDVPAITSASAAASATVAELAGSTGSADLDQAGGTVTFGDVDLTDTHQVVQSHATFAWSGGTLTSTQINDLMNASARTLVPHDSTGTGSGSIDWTHGITDSALDFLAFNQTLTVTYDITVADYHNGVATGTSATQTVTVTYTGANDAPTLASVTTPTLVDTAAVDTFAPQTGTLIGTDADSGETNGLTYAALDGAVYVNTAIAGQYGSLTVNGDGTYSYVPNAAAINALHAGSYTDTFTVQTTDVHGTSETATFTVNVTGANDAPTIAAVVTPTLIDTIVVDTFAPQTGTLIGTDADSGGINGLTYAALDGAVYVNTAIAGQYGSLTVNGDGTYSYVPNAAAINALHAGNYTDIFTVKTTDVHGASGTATFTVNVTGANDAPLIDTSNVQISTSGGNIVISGAAIVDPDAGEGFNISLLPDSGGVSGALNAITYTPSGPPPQIGQVAATVTDTAGAHDTVNFVFNVSGTGSLPMQSTSEKDVFFATAYQDTFVFISGSNQDTISGFTTGSDKIDLHLLTGSPTTGDIATWLASSAVETVGSDTLLHLNGTTDTVLVKGIAALTASDFILHA